MTPGLISSDLVNPSIRVRFAPNINGDRETAHNVIIVLCSSSVSLVVLGAPSPGVGPSSPIGSISASGQFPGFAYFAQIASNGNRPLTPCDHSFPFPQWSHRSCEIRHIWAFAPTSSAFATAVGPGDRLKTMGRPDRTIARWIMRISAALYGCEAMQSTLMKSTPQSA